MAAEPNDSAEPADTTVVRPQAVVEAVRRGLSYSLRARLTLLATMLLAIGLLAGSVLLAVALRYSLTRTVDADARETARSVADSLGSGEPENTTLSVGGGNTVVVQVIDENDRVLSASVSADHLVPLVGGDALDQLRNGKVLDLPGARAGVDYPLRVVAVERHFRDSTKTVLVAVDAGQIGQSRRALLLALSICAPLLLISVLALSWYLIGRTLRPVEDLRRGAAEITGTGSVSRRLPVSAGRDEVHRLADTLNDMLGRLEAANARQRAFVADAAHELRSPLASLRTQLEVAAHLGERADWPATAAGALIDIERLGTLVDDLLLLARIDEPGAAGRFRRARIDLAQLATELTADYADARVPVTVRAAPVDVDGDPHALRRILRNLLDNAVRHAESMVELEVSIRTGSATIVVRDDGPGIPLADRERVFARFTRLDDARSRDAGGSGLGLAIVRELVAAHGGTVALGDAAPGLRVTVRLPHE
ncbi:MAG TPA: HAMP domain-containing sensor histidine kinase [Mycobacteriales bacterium]|nr:HAMP domain-containing sensor histidine kinase [Mycobacteriales bacterium]